MGRRGRFPVSEITLRCTSLRFVGNLTPSPMSRTYIVAISYELGHTPVVTVLAPELVRPPAVGLPHTYQHDVLCLHLPGQWSTDVPLTMTTVPWTAEWLLHYELWLATDGTWCGGGH